MLNRWGEKYDGLISKEYNCWGEKKKWILYKRLE